MAAFVSVLSNVLCAVGCPSKEFFRKIPKIQKIIAYVYPGILSCALLACCVLNLTRVNWPEKTSLALLQFLCTIAQETLLPVIFIVSQRGFNNPIHIQQTIVTLSRKHWSRKDTARLNILGCMILIIVMTFASTSFYSLKDYKEWVNMTIYHTNMSNATGHQVLRITYSGICFLLAFPDIAILTQRGLLALETICLCHTLDKLQQKIVKQTPKMLRHDLHCQGYTGVFCDYELIRKEITKLNADLKIWTLCLFIYDMTSLLFIVWDLREGKYNLFNDWSFAIPTFLLGNAQVGAAAAFANKATELPGFLADNEAKILNIADSSKYESYLRQAKDRKPPALTVGGFADMNNGFIATVAASFLSLVVAFWEKK